jgi:diguanylate cyclase (GGDEF)-like protein
LSALFGPLSFRPRLVLAFTLAAMLLMAGVVGYEAHDRHQRALRHGEERVRLNNRIFGAFMQSAFDKYFLVAQHLADELKSGSPAGDAELRRLAGLDCAIMDILLLDGAGVIRHWSGQGKVPSVIDREYYTAVATPGSPAQHVSHPAKSRVHDGRWFIGLSQAVRDDRGKLLGVAVVLIDLGALADDIRGILRSETQAAALILLDGTTLVRVPGEGNFGEIIPIIAQQKGDIPAEANARAPSPFDGTPRFIHLRRLERYPVIASSSMAESEILADWRASLFGSLAMGLVGATLLGLGGLVIWRLASASQKQMGRLRELSRELRTLATTDPLTHIANRRHFDELAKVEIERARRHGGALSLAVIDIDHFKRINDVHGHPVGDAALTGLVGLIAASLRDTDLLARLGGEEFALILPHTALAGAEEFSERIRHLVEASPLSVPGAEALRITVSIGVAQWHPEEADFDAVMRRADQALYEAKSAGRNRVQFKSTGLA